MNRPKGKDLRGKLISADFPDFRLLVDVSDAILSNTWRGGRGGGGGGGGGAGLYWRRWVGGGRRVCGNGGVGLNIVFGNRNSPKGFSFKLRKDLGFLHKLAETAHGG